MQRRVSRCRERHDRSTAIRALSENASLIVIASEDTYAVKEYFARFKTYRVQVEVLPTEDTRSAPQHVVDRLDQFVKENVIVDGDTFWLCVDRDRWSEATLGEVLRHCLSKKYGIALSNPCFELWLQLHFEDVDGTKRTSVEVTNRLRELLGGGYTKRCCRTIGITKELVEVAMRRARALDTSEDLIPEAPATRVYKILDALLARDSIDFA